MSTSDEISDDLAPAGQWLRSRRLWIAIGLVVAVAVGIGTAVMVASSEPERRLAWTQVTAPPAPPLTTPTELTCPEPDECWVAGESAQFEGPGPCRTSGGPWISPAPR